MAYYPKDAAKIMHLRDQIEALGVSFNLFRKFTQLIGAISVQVEVENPSRRVIETVFQALLQQAEESNRPDSDQIKTLINDCHAAITKRLNTREGKTLP